MPVRKRRSLTARGRWNRGVPMTQSKVLLFTLVVTIGTTLAEVLAEIGRNRLATDLFDIQGAAAGGVAQGRPSVLGCKKWPA
jgi:hypothetical protein